MGCARPSKACRTWLRAIEKVALAKETKKETGTEMEMEHFMYFHLHLNLLWIRIRGELDNGASATNLKLRQLAKELANVLNDILSMVVRIPNSFLYFSFFFSIEAFFFIFFFSVLWCSGQRKVLFFSHSILRNLSFGCASLPRLELLSAGSVSFFVFCFSGRLLFFSKLMICW